MSLVSNLQSLCQQHSISIPNLEVELGFGRGTMYKWDKNSPSIDKLQKVATFFNVGVDYLLSKSPSEISPERKLFRDFINSPIDSILTKNQQDFLKLASQVEDSSDEEKERFKNAIAGVIDTNSNPTLSPKEERDIARDLEKILSNMENDEALSFYDGEPLDDESKELLRISLESSMRLAKQMAKKKFTPNKYKK